MKMFKYLLLAVAFLAINFSFAEEAKVSESVSNTSEVQQVESTVAEVKPEEKTLSEEEQGYIKSRKEMDDLAVETANKIRSSLMDIIGYVREVSPTTADFLAKEYDGFYMIQFVVAFFILLVTFLIVKFVLNSIFYRLAAAFGKANKDSFLAQFISRIHKPINLYTSVAGLYFALVFLFRDPYYVVLITRTVDEMLLLACFWAILVVIDSFFYMVARKFSKKEGSAIAHLLDFLCRVVKIVLITVAVLSVLSSFGLNVGTILASLGIGGMALAFASQETIANFFGSVSIIMDRPFVVGDWVRTSACEGHIEKIGFRSTRVKTFTQTIVTIPNASLAKEAVENYSRMPARKVVQTIGFTYSSTHEQMQNVLPAIRESLSKVEGVDKRFGVLAEFTDFANSSLDLTIVYYTTKIDFAYFTATKTRVNLALMKVVEAHGLSFAFPSTSVYIEKQ